MNRAAQRAAARVADEVRLREQLPPPQMRKALRESHHISQTVIANAIGPGCTRQAVSSWENGRRMPRGAYLAAYVSILQELAGTNA